MGAYATTDTSPCGLRVRGAHAGRRSDFVLTQGLRPGLYYVAPLGLIVENSLIGLCRVRGVQRSLSTHPDSQSESRWCAQDDKLRWVEVPKVPKADAVRSVASHPSV